MAGIVPLSKKHQRNSTYKKNACVICFIRNKLTSTENDREAIIAAAAVRNDDVLEHVNLLENKCSFSYHSPNECYKTYTMKKTLDRIKVRYHTVSSITSTRFCIYFCYVFACFFLRQEITRL